MKRFAEQGSEQDFLASDAAVLRGIFAGAGLSDAEVQVYVDALGTPAAMRAALNWYSAMGTGPGRPVPTPAAVSGSAPLPTLYVWGPEDVAFTRAAAEGTRDFARVPLRFEVREGGGHWVPEEAAQVLDALLLEHLGRREDSPSGR
jgi:pimeloyl-ACP methyl ester carboxylesterase